MFGFLRMLGNYDERKVEHFEDGDLIVDTCAVPDSVDPFETAVQHPLYNENKWVIVETYSDKEAAIVGHKKWVSIMTGNILPRELKDVSSAEIAKLCDVFDDPDSDDNWRKNKAIII